MWKKADRSRILRDLADSLDVDRTLARHPEITPQDLSRILRESADMVDPLLEEIVVMVDGAARGNPGPAGAGFLIRAGRETTLRRGEYLGEATNNVAEYNALILGLEAAIDMGAIQARVYSDSELLIKQMNGEYRVKNPRLRELFALAQKAAGQLKKVSYSHIPREKNREADRLANMAIDAKGPVSL